MSEQMPSRSEGGKKEKMHSILSLCFWRESHHLHGLLKSCKLVHFINSFKCGLALKTFSFTQICKTLYLDLFIMSQTLINCS